MERSLEKGAADEGTTVNALANSILGEYFDWRKKVEEFGFISLHKPIVIRLIEELDDETLARIGREDVAASWIEQAEFFLQDSSPNETLKAMNRRSKTNPGAVTRITQEENAYTIVMLHDFGPKWSIVVKSALQEFVRQSFHVEPQIIVGESVVTARFEVNPKNLPS
ncbi:MAG: hypothetical protein ABSB29_10090 [Nitrososphaerales archaeon]